MQRKAAISAGIIERQSVSRRILYDLQLIILIRRNIYMREQ